MKLKICVILLLYSLSESSAFLLKSFSYVVPPIRTRRSSPLGNGGRIGAEIENVSYRTTVTDRYAKTQITTRVKNYADVNKEVLFAALVPENAYVSSFKIEVDNKTYEGVVKEKEEAREIYKESVTNGQTSGYVEMSAQNSQLFKVSVNVEPYQKVTFHLIYEELLIRKNDIYDIFINILPGASLYQLDVQVDIKETIPLRMVGTPPLRTISKGTEVPVSIALMTDVNVINDNTVTVHFHPSKYDQELLCRTMHTNTFAAQFVVQYDVARNPTGEPALTQEGYFVQFFAPTKLVPLPKYVIYILDTSGSMSGNKLTKLKEAMAYILTKLEPNDIFNIVQFESNTFVWDIADESSKLIYQEYTSSLKTNDIPPAVKATDENIQHAQSIIEKITILGGTNIERALETGILLAQTGGDAYESIIIFLTDGVPHEGITDPKELINKVSGLNIGENKAAIFCLSFGEDADEEFLKALSKLNYASHHHIYDAANSAILLTNFFHEYSTPLLKEVDFEFQNTSVQEITKTQFPHYFAGGELIVAGKLENEDQHFTTSIKARNIRKNFGDQEPREAVADLERLFVYLSIKQAMEDMEIVENKTALREKVLEKALKYSFVTPITSLVVGKPNDVQSVAIIEDAFKGEVTNEVEFTNVIYDEMESDKKENEYDDYADNMWYPATVDGRMLYVHKLGDSKEEEEDVSQENARTLENLKQELPWLNDILNPDETVTTGGGWYKLGIGEPVKWKMICMNPIRNSRGYCRLLDQCLSHIKGRVNSAADFEDHFCTLNEYAGICCPD